MRSAVSGHESGRLLGQATALLGNREAMSITNAALEEDNDETDSCDKDWCGGPESETLPCFECFDPAREYATKRTIDDATEHEG